MALAFLVPEAGGQKGRSVFYAPEKRGDLQGTCPETLNPYLALSLHSLSVDHTNVDMVQDALVTSEEALAIRRKLVGRDPDKYHPDLAASLNNVSCKLSGLGRIGEALTAIQEAVDTR